MHQTTIGAKEALLHFKKLHQSERAHTKQLKKKGPSEATNYFQDKRANMVIMAILAGEKSPKELIVKRHYLRVGFILGLMHH